MEEFNFLNESEWYHRSYVEELKKQSKKHINMFLDEKQEKERFARELIVEREEKERLEKALQFYADKRTWAEPTRTYSVDNYHDGPPAAIEDSGELARKTLGGDGHKNT